jgi:hypothetical protein
MHKQDLTTLRRPTCDLHYLTGTLAINKFLSAGESPLPAHGPAVRVAKGPSTDTDPHDPRKKKRIKEQRSKAAVRAPRRSHTVRPPRRCNSPAPAAAAGHAGPGASKAALLPVAA